MVGGCEAVSSLLRAAGNIELAVMARALLLSCGGKGQTPRLAPKRHRMGPVCGPCSHAALITRSMARALCLLSKSQFCLRFVNV